MKPSTLLVLAVCLLLPGISRSAELLRTLEGHKEKRDIWDMEVSPDGRILASCDRLGELKLWGLGMGHVIATCRGRLSLAFRPDGKQLASVRDKTSIALWEPSSGKLLNAIEDVGEVSAVEFSTDGKLLLVGTFDHQVLLFNSETLKQERRIDGANKMLTCLAINRQGSVIASGNEGHTADDGSNSLIYLWSRKGRKLRELRSDPAMGAQGVRFSPDGGVLAAGCGDRVWTWVVSSGQLLNQYSVPDSAASIGKVAFSPNGRLLMGTSGFKVVLWDSQTAEVVMKTPEDEAPTFAACFSSDGKLLIAAFENKIKVWDISDLKPVTGSKINLTPRGSIFGRLFGK